MEDYRYDPRLECDSKLGLPAVQVQIQNAILSRLLMLSWKNVGTESQENS